MQENPESQEQAQPQSQSDEWDEYGMEIDQDMESSDESESSDEETEVTEGAEGDAEDGEETEASSTEESDEDEDGEETEEQETIKGSAGKSETPIGATTDDAWSESAKEMLDENSPDISYHQVPKANLKNIIVSSDEIMKELDQYWSEKIPRRMTNLKHGIKTI